jgi:hypothetical protein
LRSRITLGSQGHGSGKGGACRFHETASCLSLLGHVPTL